MTAADSPILAAGSRTTKSAWLAQPTRPFKPQAYYVKSASRIRPGVRLQWSVVYRRVDDLNPDPRNPRHHSKKQIRQIARSIETFGFIMPILVDPELRVIVGHGRLRACPKLGITEVPTLLVDHLTRAQPHAFMITDNRLTELATWDDRLLAEQLRDLSPAGLDFDIDVTGFEMAEIDLRIASLMTCPSKATTVPISCPKSRPGRLSASSAICGSSVPIASCAATGSILRPSQC
jgi:hypothetical protein